MKRPHLIALPSAICLLSLALALPAERASAQATEKPAAVQNKQHRVVFEISSDDKEQWTALLNNVENLQKAFGHGKVQTEVVAHGKALGLLIKDSPVAERLEKIAATGVVFAACENTMKRKNVASEQLLPSAITTDSGVAEVVRKQAEGWAYIKSGS
ncbi:DsrE family protein [Verrucomicrobiota bacterium sgz303538]